MRETKYVSGYGYITQNGSGFWQDAGTDLITNIGKKVVGAIGDRVGSKIADKIVGKKKKESVSTRESAIRESVLKDLDLLPKQREYGIPEDVRKALYGSGVKGKKSKNLI